MAKKKLLPLRERKETYICVGEDFGPGLQIGYCGDCNTLWAWVNELFPEYDAEQLERYYGNESDEKVLDAILIIKRKKLNKC